ARSRTFRIGWSGWSEGRGRSDRDRPDPAGPGAARQRLPRALLHGGRARLLRLEAEPRAALRPPLRRQGGGRQGARLRRLLHLEGDRDPRPAEAGRAPRRPHQGLGREGARGADRALDDALAGAGGGDRRRRRGVLTYEPLYTAAEMRAAEERYPGFPETTDELMERAGRAVAEEAL